MSKRYDLRSKAESTEDLNRTMIDAEDTTPVTQSQLDEVLSCIRELAKTVSESHKEISMMKSKLASGRQLQDPELETDAEDRKDGEMEQQQLIPENQQLPTLENREILQQQWNLAQNNKLYDLPQFSGIAEEWPLFIANFKETTTVYRYSNRENLMRLQKCLQGQARETVLSMLIYPESVPNVIDELEFRFGRPEILVRSQLMKIQQFPVINHKKLGQFIEFSTKVRNVVSFLNSANCSHHLMNVTLLEELINKLPSDKQFEWARFSMNLKPHATIIDFSLWLSDMARVVSLMPTSPTQVLPSKSLMVIDKPKSFQCSFCKKDHVITKCKEFEKLSLEERWEKAKHLKLCFSCLYKGHGTALCRNKKPCGIENCKRNHNKILHGSSKNASVINSPQNQENSKSLQPMFNCRTQQASILFKIFPVTIYGPAGYLKVFAMFDEGSSISLISEDIANQLGLKGKSSPLTLQWYGNKVVTEKSFKVHFEIKGLYEAAKKYSLKNVQTVSNLNLPQQQFNKSDYKELQSVPLESYSNTSPVILLGLDYSHLATPLNVKECQSVKLIAAETKLGWVVYGPTSSVLSRPSTVMIIQEDEIHKVVEEFIENENLGINTNVELLLSDENINAKKIMENTTRKVGNRFEIGLLWKEYPPRLPQSFEMARKRLLTIERKMCQDHQYASKYKKEIYNYLEKGYARKLTEEEIIDSSAPVWYLPHFGVTSLHKPEKLRIVFDAAAKVGDISLNSALVKGPEQAKSLLGILMKFREGTIAVAADIKEMFSQIKIRDIDQHSQRFLWRNGNLNEPIQCYAMESMTFGAICSPCCAEYIKNVNALQFAEQFPEAVAAVIDKHYVDDFVCSFSREDEALKICKEVVFIHSQGGFQLRGFTSNNKRIEEIMNNGEIDNITPVQMEKHTSIDKILGMYWNKEEDIFVFHTQFQSLPTEVFDGYRVPTKRELLRITMSIFDPFGMIADFLLYSKTFVQKSWKTNIDWDDAIPVELHKSWNVWWEEFRKICNFRIPRCLSSNLLECNSIQLHVFVDASQEAYAAVCYFRIICNNKTEISFVIGKVRCAPKKLLSIPRLELQAAILGVRLSKAVKQSHNIKIASCYYWTDSQTVLRWINSKERRFKAFVSHRIAEIIENTQPKQWNWVPSQLNTADAGTRTVYPPKFKQQSEWITGPSFLKANETQWPKTVIDIPSHNLEEELKPNLVVCYNNTNLFNFERFSSYTKLKRTVAWIWRFANKEWHKGKQLSVTEVERAEKTLCRLVQHDCFQNEQKCLKYGKSLPKSSQIYSLVPFLDSDDLLRDNSRLTQASCLPFDARKPVILPQKHIVSEMIVKLYHEKYYHQNTFLAINEIRQKYWIPHIKAVMKKIIRNCLVCQNESAKPHQPQMGELPLDRITPYVRPFAYTGVDLFGPFNVAVGRRREKRYAVIFTCLTVRAAHIEIAESLSTDSFILCLRNFINRRGTPVRIRSDNGTNFLGAQKLLKNNEEQIINVDDINSEAVKRNIEWIFNCPLNPSSGGCWERLIRIVKRLLQKTLKEVAPRVETLRCVLIEAENIINSRPLTEIPISAYDEDPFTPNHFLMGCPNTTQTKNVNDEAICLRKQWRIAQDLKDRLWKRWIKEYLPQLLCRPKWLEKVEPLKPDDVVLILDNTLPRFKWQKGIILKTYPAKDGQVRSADVKTTKGVIRRPASKLAKLKVNQNDSQKGECCGLSKTFI